MEDHRRSVYGFALAAITALSIQSQLPGGSVAMEPTAVAAKWLLPPGFFL